MSPNQAIPAEKSNRSSLLAAVGPLTILSWPETLNASRSKRACRMAIRRNACSPLALPDFPEFAQAVRCGVPGTTDAGVIVMALRGIQRHQEPLNRLPIVLYLASGLSPDLISVTMENESMRDSFTSKSKTTQGDNEDE